MTKTRKFRFRDFRDFIRIIVKIFLNSFFKYVATIRVRAVLS